LNVLLQYRFVIVIALLAIAVALLADPARLPLALRGLRRALGGGARVQADPPKPVSGTRRVAAFALVVLAFLVAIAGG